MHSKEKICKHNTLFWAIGLIFIFININLRNIDYEIQRQKALERELNCVFIRINPDAVDFNIFREINKIHRHIKKSSKKSLIDKISKRLLELEFQYDHSIKSKCLKWNVRKILPTLQKINLNFKRYNKKKI